MYPIHTYKDIYWSSVLSGNTHTHIINTMHAINRGMVAKNIVYPHFKTSIKRNKFALCQLI